eukprot:COSAG01_NODE_1184_length_11346_cov_58.600249_4_plen_31_part_00
MSLRWEAVPVSYLYESRYARCLDCLAGARC